MILNILKFIFKLIKIILIIAGIIYFINYFQSKIYPPDNNIVQNSIVTIQDLANDINSDSLKNFSLYKDSIKNILPD